MVAAAGWSSLVAGAADDGVRRMADGLPHAVFTTDAPGRITFWNRAAERITGWSSAEAIGKTCSLLAGDAVNGCACGVGPVRCGLVQRSRSAKTCTLRTRDGRLLLIVKNAVPLLAPDGTIVGALEAFSEVGPAGGERRLPSPRGAAKGAPAAPIVGEHPAIVELRRAIALIASSGVTVLITGESGSGKSLAAAAIHAASPRATGPLVRLVCAGFDERAIEAAEGGSLVLDELADLSASAQTRLLRLLEVREVERAGTPAVVRVDARLLCTTNRDLRALVAAGRFRADLYFRLAAFPLPVPPLRDHLDDLPRLAEAFLARRAPTTTGRARRIAPAALAALGAAPWPGNVRELENVLAAAALRAGDGDLELAHLPPELARPPRRDPRRLPSADEIRAALAACGGNRTAAARHLGISRVTLWKTLKRLGP